MIKTDFHKYMHLAWLIIVSLTIASQTQAQSVNGDSLYIKELILAENVVEREPVNVVQSFDISDKKGWCFARINNPGDIKTISFIWFHDDDLHYEMETKVGKSSNWRTYSSVTLEEGTWRVEIVGPDSTTLKEIRFNVSD